MSNQEIVQLLLEERARIDKALQILTGQRTTKLEDYTPTYPENLTPTGRVKKKRNMSPEGRARIAEAVKKRWATQKRAAKK